MGLTFEEIESRYFIYANFLYWLDPKTIALLCIASSNKQTKAFVKAFIDEKYEKKVKTHFPFTEIDDALVSKIRWQNYYHHLCKKEYQNNDATALFIAMKDGDFRSIPSAERIMKEMHLYPSLELKTNHTVLNKNVLYITLHENYVNLYLIERNNQWETVGGGTPYGQIIPGIGHEIPTLEQLKPHLGILLLKTVIPHLNYIDANRDQYQKTLCYWAKQLGYTSFNEKLYELVSKDFRNNNGVIDTTIIDQEGRTIFYWLILLQQPLDIILPLLKQDSVVNENYLQRLKQMACFCAQEGHLALLKQLVEENKEVINGVDEEQSVNNRKRSWTPLIYAVYYGQADIVAHLLELGVDPNISHERRNNQKLITLAAQCGHLEVIKVLLAQHPQLISEPPIRESSQSGSIFCSYDDYPLSCAAYHGHLHVVRYLLTRDPQFIEKTFTLSGWAGLVNAFTNTRPNLHKTANITVFSKIVFELYNTNPSLFEQHHDGLGLLYFAANSGWFDMVKFLVNTIGVDINLRTDRGHTPIYLTLHTYMNRYDTINDAGRKKVLHFLLKQPSIELDRVQSKMCSGLNEDNYILGKYKLYWHRAQIKKEPDSYIGRFFNATWDKIPPLHRKTKAQRLAAINQLIRVYEKRADVATLLQHQPTIDADLSKELMADADIFFCYRNPIKDLLALAKQGAQENVPVANP